MKLWLVGIACGLLGVDAARAACPDPEQHRCALDSGEVRVEVAEVAGGGREVCGIAVLDAPLEDIALVLKEADTYEEFMPHVKASELSVDSEGERLNSQRLDLPFPLNDRHYTVRLRERSLADHGWELSWQYVEGSGNVDDTQGSWLLQPWGDATLLTYRTITDPGGMIPKWVSGRISKRTFPKLVRAVEKRAAELE